MEKRNSQGVTPKSETYRVQDLATCSVYTETGECLGQLVDVLPAGGNDVWVVQGKHELLLPAKVDVIQSIDLAAKRIVVKLPSGLRDVYEPPAD